MAAVLGNTECLKVNQLPLEVCIQDLNMPACLALCSSICKVKLILVICDCFFVVQAMLGADIKGDVCVASDNSGVQCVNYTDFTSYYVHLCTSRNSHFILLPYHFHKSQVTKSKLD